MSKSTEMEVVESQLSSSSSIVSSVDELQTSLNNLILRLFETLLAVRDDSSTEIRTSLGEPSVHSDKILNIYREMQSQIEKLPG